MIIRDYQPEDEAAVLALNAASVAVLSPMDGQRFRLLHGMAARLRVAEHDGQVAGFLMGFCGGTDYDSINYQWFTANYEEFFYVDRVVVDDSFRGLGVASSFYDESIRWAGTEGLTSIVAEIDIEPPNIGSLKFHEKYGFEELDRLVHSPEKVVSLQRLRL